MSSLQRWSMLLILAALAAIPGSAPTGVTRPADRFAGSLPPEVRLRKMHLVRPDLIPYPFAVEVYC